MLGPFLLPFVDVSPPVVVDNDDGGDSTSYAYPVLHYVYFKSKCFEYSYSFSSFRLKEYKRDCRVRFNSKAYCFSDTSAQVYVKDGFDGKSTCKSISKGSFYYRIDFLGKSENMFKDSSKADFVLATYDNKYEAEEAAMLFQLCINL